MDDYQKLLKNFSNELDKTKDTKEALECLDKHAKQFDPDGTKLKRYKLLQELKEKFQK